MRLLIDASNLLAGGGKTHLVELLRHANAPNHGFSTVVLYGHTDLLQAVPDKPWLQKVRPWLLNYGYPGRFCWRTFFRREAANGLWFVPGAGTAPGKFATMCQNLLPLDSRERDRYFCSVVWLRLVLLGRLHRRAYRKACGVIFLNEYCFRALPVSDQGKIARKIFIPHGVSERFFQSRSISRVENCLRLIYVSAVEEYKHQWRIAETVARLRTLGFNLSIDFIGSAGSRSFGKLRPYLCHFIRYHGEVSYEDLPEWYANADAFIFGSTCETFGMVLLEAMASGLPVLCSSHSSMPETVRENAVYFDPLSPTDIDRVIRHVYGNQMLLLELSRKGKVFASEFSWTRATTRTLEFLARCANEGVSKNH